MIVQNAPSVKTAPANGQAAPAPLAGDPLPLWRRQGYSCYVCRNTSRGGTFLSWDVELCEPGDKDAFETLAQVAADPYRTQDEALTIARWIAIDPDVLGRLTGERWRGVIDRRAFVRGDGKPLSELSDPFTAERRADEAARTGRLEPADEATATDEDGQATVAAPAAAEPARKGDADASASDGDAPAIEPARARPGMLAFGNNGEQVVIVACLDECCVYRMDNGTYGADAWDGIVLAGVVPDPSCVSRTWLEHGDAGRRAREAAAAKVEGADTSEGDSGAGLTPAA